MKMSQLMFASFCLLLAACGGNSTSEENTTTPDAAQQPAEPVVAEPTAPAANEFTKTVNYDNIIVTVSSPNAASGNTFTVTTAGLTEVNVTNDSYSTNGMVTDVLIDDLDGDNSPEFFVIARPSDGGLASVHAFSTFNRKSLGQINFPDQSSNPDVSAAFKEGDEYMPVANNFVMRFPIYEAGDKTGKTRQLQLKVKPGEAMKQLVFDRKTEY